MIDAFVKTGNMSELKGKECELSNLPRFGAVCYSALLWHKLSKTQWGCKPASGALWAMSVLSALEECCSPGSHAEFMGHSVIPCCATLNIFHHFSTQT